MSHTTVLKARWILPMTPGSQVLEQHALVIQGERIAAVLPQADAATAYPDAEQVDLGQLPVQHCWPARQRSTRAACSSTRPSTAALSWWSIAAA